MTCRECIEFLLDYFGGDLAAEERACFEQHLAACPPCVTYIEQYRDTVRLGKFVCCHENEAVPAEVPEDLIRAILAARPVPRDGEPRST